MRNCKKSYAIGMVLVLLVLCGVGRGGTLESNRYYTWQIAEPNVPIGSIITDVQITLHSLKTPSGQEGPGVVQIWLVDAPPRGWVGNDGSVNVGSLLASLVTNDVNSVTDLADVILADSWTYDIFKQPFEISYPLEDGFEHITMNAAILEFNDYMGNGTPAGLLLRSIGGKSIVSRITVKMTIRAYMGSYRETIEVVSINVPKDMVAINAWADKERLDLMADFMERLMELESRIADAKE